MKKNSKLIILGLVLMTIVGLGIRGLVKIEETSTSQPVETIPVYDIGAHPNHPFYAIGEQVILTVTVEPADASDKTVVWTSSEPTKVSITKLTDSTAKMECLAAFTGEIVITATATNGTADPSDDFSVTCTVTYVVPLTAIELTWEGSTSIDPATYEFEIGDTLFFNVEFTPANATDKDFELFYDDTYLEPSVLDPYSDIQLDIIAETPLHMPTEIEIIAGPEGELNDTISITVGKEFDTSVNPSMLLTDSEIYRSTNAGSTWTEIGNSLDEYVGVYEEYGYSFNTGDFIHIDIGSLDFKGVDFNGSLVKIVYDPDYLTMDETLMESFDHEYSMITEMYTPEMHLLNAVNFTPSSNCGIVLEVIAPVAASADYSVNIILPAYSHYELVPFVFTRPVSGISIDTGTYVF